SRTSNALNPCFVSLIYAIISVVFGVFAGFQLLQSLSSRQKFGNLSQLKSCGIYHWIRLNSVLLQSILYLIVVFENLQSEEGAKLTDVKVAGFGLTALVILLIFLPLHAIEVTTSVVQSASLLLFWPFHIFCNLAVVIQQVFSKHKILGDSTVISGVEYLLLFNSISIFVLEFLNWSPTEELIEYYKENGLKLKVPNIISLITFSNLNEFMAKGVTEEGITEDDIPIPTGVQFTKDSSEILLKNWKHQLDKNPEKPSLAWALFKSVFLIVIFSITLDVSNSFLSVVQPQFLRILISFFVKDNDQPLIIGFGVSLAMFAVSILQTAFFNQYLMLIFESGIRAKSGLMSLVYQKALHLSAESKQERSTGDIVNLMSVDVGRVQEMFFQLQILVSAPTQLVLCLISLYSLLGKSVFSAAIIVLLIVPVNVVMIKTLRGLHKQQMKYKDMRTKTMNEILTSIKSIKLYSWEKPMLAKLEDIRNNKELKNLKKIGMLSATVQFVWSSIPFFISCSIFSVFAFISNTPLTPDIVFPALSLFNLLSEPFFAIPAVVTSLIETGVALGRITSFLLCDELNPEVFKELPKVNHLGDVSVKISNITFLWSRPKTDKKNYDEENEISTPKVALKDVNFTARKGQLTCIVGRVGAGKSSFIKALLGELVAIPAVPTEPMVTEIHGSVAYCSQVAWIMNASLKDNILCGSKFDEDFYQRTIESCQLLDDIDILPDGDDTLVGEKGISLSGGQKARVSLARAVYARADVYLLDDILSAVDAHVGKNIVDQVLSETGLLATKTIILATNSVSVLKHSKNIVLLSGGEIIERGSYKAVMSKKSALYALIDEFGQVGTNQLDSEGLALTTTITHQSLRRSSMASYKKKPLIDLNETSNKRTAQEAEKAEKGKVQWSIYVTYAKSCGYFGVCLFLTLIVLTTALSVADNYWLKYWAEKNAMSGSNKSVLMFVAIYAGLGIASDICILARTAVMFFLCSIRGSRLLHDNMAKSVLRAPMSFFETTPIGRIMNRFSNDVNKVDEMLPRTFSGFFGSCVRTIFTVGVIAYSMPVFLLVMVALSLWYIYYQRFYVATSRQLKRISSITVSPIFAHLQESLNGSDTIRAYRQEDRFNFLNSANIDFNMRAMHTLRSSNRWLAARLQFIGSLIIFSASLLALYTLTTSTPLTSGMVGLLMSYALQVTDSLNWVVRSTVDVESNIVCVERILEYSKLKSEASEIIENHRPPAYWPSEGRVKFDHYSTKYRANLDPVLNDINLDIQPSEKIGIVGRTGAGKSTLAMAIFRLIEATEGHIEIDNINTSEIGLYDLRHKLSIIPQDSQAIEGTMRQNLDPLGQHSDEELWRVLELSHLKTHVLSMAEESKGKGEEILDSALEVKISEGGGNLSVGQRQLMCLARALLNPSKVLILDEATAAVDVQTDKILQQTIRSEFKDKTILTIAHRLETVLDSDRVVVLEKGHVAEFDTPTNLLANKDSIFYSLCNQGGYL
ncbi:hypothetical protein PACTADRAFT_20700, partial [Pachysolen tannophilus NRRL Y-2460]